MNLFVGNLSPETTEDDLRNLFSEFGEIVTIKVVKDTVTGDSRGFGFVEMADKFHAYDCIDNIDMTFFQGNVISVKEAKPKGSDKPGGGFKKRPRTFGPREGGSEGGERRPFSGGGERRPFSGGSGNAERRPFSGGGERRPFSGGSGERRPFNGGGERRPFNNDPNKFNENNNS
jgi:RNA recognition motif-containing protein